MNNSRKWLALILAAVLALSLSAPALAAEAAVSPEETAAEFMALLDREGIEYSDYGIDYDGDYFIEIFYPGDSMEEHDINLYIDSSGLFFSAYEWYLLEYDASRLDEVLETVNELNSTGRFVSFTADTSDDTITAKIFGVLRGDPGSAARVLFRALIELPRSVDRAWPVLKELPAVAADEPDGEEPDFVGTWKFTSMTFTGESGELPEGTVLTVEDFGNVELFRMELKEGGKMSLTSFGIRVEGTWVQDGNTVTLSDETGDFFAELLDGDTLLLDTSEDVGYILTMTRAE